MTERLAWLGILGLCCVAGAIEFYGWLSADDIFFANAWMINMLHCIAAGLASLRTFRALS